MSGKSLPPDQRKNLSAFVRDLLAKFSGNQSALATRLGVAQPTVSDALNHGAGGMKLLLALARVGGTSVDAILAGEAAASPPDAGPAPSTGAAPPPTPTRNVERHVERPYRFESWASARPIVARRYASRDPDDLAALLDSMDQHAFHAHDDPSGGRLEWWLEESARRLALIAGEAQIEAARAAGAAPPELKRYGAREATEEELAALAPPRAEPAAAGAKKSGARAVKKGGRR